MSTRILPAAAALLVLAGAAAAQTPPAKDQPAPGMELGGAVQPVMDQTIFAHLFFNELEGRFNGSNTEFRWEGQGWVGTDYDKLWIKSEGTLQGNGPRRRPAPIPLQPRDHDLFRSAGRAAQRYRFTADPQLGGAGHSRPRALLF